MAARSRVFAGRCGRCVVWTAAGWLAMCMAAGPAGAIVERPRDGPAAVKPAAPPPQREDRWTESPAVGLKSDTQREFERLYKQYSARFYDKMTLEAENMEPAQVFAEAARIWGEVFGPHKDVLARRAAELLQEFDPAPPIQEEQYNEVACWTRSEPKPGTQQPIILRQLAWSPTGAAQVALGDFLNQLLSPKSRTMRQVMGANAILFWEAIDRDEDRPKLMLRQGPMLFLFDLSRKDDYYMVDKIRWLRPKSMGPITPAGGGKPQPAVPPAERGPDSEPAYPAPFQKSVK